MEAGQADLAVDPHSAAWDGRMRLANSLFLSGDAAGARSCLRAAAPGSAFRGGTPPGDLGDRFHLEHAASGVGPHDLLDRTVEGRSACQHLDGKAAALDESPLWPRAASLV